MKFLQSFAGFPVRVSPGFMPLTSAFKATLNEFAGKEIYPTSSKSHGEISWTPEVEKVSKPVKPCQLTCIKMHNVLDVWTMQSSAVIDFHGIQPQYDGYDGYSEYTGHRTNGKGGWIARNLGRKPRYKDRRLRANGSGATRAVNATW